MLYTSVASPELSANDLVSLWSSQDQGQDQDRRP